MSKRLILILALAFVVGITVAAFAEVQNVKVSGDLTMMGASRELTLGQNSGDRDRSQFYASITRVKVDADLTDNVLATVRLLNERYWGGESEGVTDAQDSNANLQLDLAYVTLKEFLYSPLTLMIGRQELHYGNDMIVGDPDTNLATSTSSAFNVGEGDDPDLSARKAFDAIRAVLNYDPLVLDLVIAKVTEGDITGTKNSNDDTDLYGINAAYALSSKTKLEGYWWLRQIGKEAASTNKKDQTHVVGARVSTQIADNLTAGLEGAYQFGRDVNATKTVKRSAYALEAVVTQALPKVKFTPTITGVYAWFSGQKGDNLKVNHAWDPMYENQTTGHIANALFPQSNAQLLGAIVTAKPKDDLTLKGEYYAYWWDKMYGENQVIASARGENTVMRHKKFAAQELDLTATYDYTEDVQLSLLTGFLKPGSAFTKDNRNIANEVIGSMKVSF